MRSDLLIFWVSYDRGYIFCLFALSDDKRDTFFVCLPYLMRKRKDDMLKLNEIHTLSSNEINKMNKNEIHGINIVCVTGKMGER